MDKALKKNNKLLEEQIAERKQPKKLDPNEYLMNKELVKQAKRN